MVSPSTIKKIHAPLFVLISLSSIIALAISASLVSHYNSTSYPSASIRDRVRLLLVASIWETFFGLYFLVGVLVKPAFVAFGILAHIVANTIGFLLFIIGAAALTAITNNKSCGVLDFSRCSVVKGLVVISWIDVIFIFLSLIFVVALGVSARSGAGMRRGALTDA